MLTTASSFRAKPKLVVGLNGFGYAAPSPNSLGMGFRYAFTLPTTIAKLSIVVEKSISESIKYITSWVDDNR